MKKKVLSLVLTTALATSMLAGCGSEAPAESSAPATNTETKTEAPADPAPAPEATVESGKVFNIYCWNTEFQDRVKMHYPGYEEVDGTTGKIGDVTVKWNITPSDDNAYQNNLDETLLKQESAAADDRIDLFLIEADYALKYVDTPYTMAISDLGITDADLANQYQYTKDIVTDGNGVLKGVSWQGCPGAYFYSREAAKEIFGTDDPAAIQEYVKDWDTFTKTAEKVKAAGYQMVSSANDTYRVYSNNVTSKWVVDGKVNIDANILKWVDDSKVMVDAGYAGTHDLWGDDWSAGFHPNGKVFSYFGPAWLINFCMAADVEGSIANIGGWAATEGPQGFYWGGTWICAATGTDNADITKDIILTLTANEEVMVNIVKQADDFVNNKPAMEAMAADTTYASKVLGGQNPLAMYCAGAEKISLENQSAYDQGCNEEFQQAMKAYFLGQCTKDEAIQAFYTAVVEKYPELTY